MRCAWLRIIHPICAFTPCSTKQIYQFSGRHTVAFIWTNIVPACFCFIFILSFCNRQVSEEWFKHMLVWTR